jgi:DNA mismatch endonuclease (patch repair protein)
MPDASSPEVARRMQLQRRRDTGPELAVRRLVHAHGLRYRVNALLPIPGVRRRTDLLFTARKVAVFVDGCYWHGCPLHATWPKANATWWADKLAANVARDRDTDRRLQQLGWTVVRIWEHEDPADAARRVVLALSNSEVAGSWPAKGSRHDGGSRQRRNRIDTPGK